MSHRRHSLGAALIGLVLAAGCVERAPDPEAMNDGSDTEVVDPDPIRTDEAIGGDAEATDREVRATTELASTEGSDVTGAVRFFDLGPEGVRIEGEVTGLAEGSHGFHVHEVGDCSAPDASSAGGHFAPDGSPHGSPDDPESLRHVGDLGNITANSDGVARIDKLDTVVSLSGDESVVGRSIVIHEGADDLEDQPAGESGRRMACGVIIDSDHP